MLQTRKIKLCLVGDMLSGGGAERVHALLSIYFADSGIEVHNVIVQNKISYDYKGELLNLGLLKDSRNGISNKLKRLKVLDSYLRKHDFNFIIDFRIRQKPVQDWIIAKFIYKSPAIFTVHSSHLQWYMPQNKWLTQAIYSDAYGIVSITNKMQSRIEALYSLNNLSTIYNPVSKRYIDNRISEGVSDLDFNYIVAAGSMDHDVKQFDKLISAYSKSVLPDNDIKLLILGNGNHLQAYKELSVALDVEDNVLFMGFQDNPYQFMKNAKFTILSSKFEGLPMVLLESLACGTPVVSFDCFSGPSEIVVNGTNGLLIEDQNFDALATGMNLMITDTRLYNYCKANALASTDKFLIENIGRQWLDYLKINLY
ncbi:MAG: glycosyltransferase family 4 protein [Flavobacterium sp.]|nr:MAG: glycosyltransferase family 4 protein [Flavobacterium sp.]